MTRNRISGSVMRFPRPNRRGGNSLLPATGKGVTCATEEIRAWFQATRRATVKVTVQADKARGFLAPRALGMASSAADNHLMDPLMPQILQSAGVTTLRYPGGNYSDTYQWSTYKPTKW